VYFKQTFRGVEIVNADLNVHVDKYGRVFSYSSSFFDGPAPQEDNLVMQSGESSSLNELSPVEAVSRLAGFLRLPEMSASEDMVTSFVSDAKIFPGNTNEDPVFLVSKFLYTHLLS
jgi:hypothetical protein